MATIQTHLSNKQIEAFNLFFDNNIEELLYGGGAGGGKSFLMAFTICICASKYPGCRMGLGREELKALKQSTLLTLWDVFKIFDLQKDRDYNYNSVDGVVKFSNGTELYLIELKEQPSDPEFDRLGSKEYTFVFIDQAEEISAKAYDVLKTRCRYKTMEFGVTGKVFSSCNPGKNFLYRRFYRPSVNRELKPPKAFVPALVTDNPFIDPLYIKQLEESEDNIIVQRLRYGNWNYSDDPQQLIPYSFIEMNLVDSKPEEGHKKASLDVARAGGDECIIAHETAKTLVNLRNIEISITAHTDISGQIADAYISYCTQNGIGYENANADAVGVGGGVVDACRRKEFFIREYIGSGRVELQDDNSKYANMRAFSYWQLRKSLQKGEFKIYKDIPNLDVLIEDLTAVKYEIDDRTIKIEDKDNIKRRIGRSPDRGDAVAMLFDLPTLKEKVETETRQRFKTMNDTEIVINPLIGW